MSSWRSYSCLVTILRVVSTLSLSRSSTIQGRLISDYARTATKAIFSPFALDLGTVVFDLSYQGVYLGSGTGPNTLLVPLFPYDAERMLTPIISPQEIIISPSPVFLFLKPQPPTSLWFLNCSPIS
jgi:hypothetical protein